jgi:hypothetical protein
MATLGGDRTALLGTLHYHPRLMHQPSCLRSSYSEPLVLELCGHTPSALTMTCVGRDRLDTGSQEDFLRINFRAGVSGQIRITPTTADLKHLTQDSNRPGVVVLGHKGRPPFDPLAKKPRAFFKLSRAMRHRLFASRHRCNSS